MSALWEDEVIRTKKEKKMKRKEIHYSTYNINKLVEAMLLSQILNISELLHHLLEIPLKLSTTSHIC